MLHLDQFDIKTGKPIQVDINGQAQTALKQVEHSYLEHWLTTNGIDAQFSVARFYESVNDADRLRLESEGKYLAFAHGDEGYFTDRATAQLMALGSDIVSPIYAGDRNSPHNMVAYGGLISSDGVASTVIPSARLLIIDDEQRTHGPTPLFDRKGRPVSEEQLASLYDKMGDGTMLVSERTTRALQTPEEQDKIAAKEADKGELGSDITTLAQDLVRSEATVDRIEKQEIRLAQRTVMQFRAASPDLPGIAKGTMTSSSYWCDRLGVDAIISSNDIKGADQRLLNPGIKEVSNVRFSRKTQAQYGRQSVGPQVEYTIPEATRDEFKPRIQKEAEGFAQVAGDFDALSQYYVEQKERTQKRASQEEDIPETHRSDWAYKVLTADRYGQLTGEAQVVRKLSRYTQRKWLDLAENGLSVPSAVAQHHSQLKVWEVCNKDLPHGAIVAYYRSPFPNVSAAAIAINNTEIIKAQDREAFSKNGVVYLSPWTAKNIAITDFDGDRNGFFVGYTATVSDLPQQIRAELASVSSLPPDEQYEAGRALFERMIEQAEQSQEARLAPADYPVAVREFIERNAPNVKPPQINKQPKQKHLWQDEETHSAATWRAWQITADNPITKVASAGMTLQALSLEMQYAPPAQKEALVKKHSLHFAKLLEKVKAGEVSIPSDDWLSSQGFSPYYEERIEEISRAGEQLNRYEDPQRRSEVVEIYSQGISTLLSDVASGPNSLNLQTAVDMAKSSQGIDQDVHSFVMALPFKGDAFRYNKDNLDIYTVDHMPMPTNMAEPVSDNVRIVNAAYSHACLELKNQLTEQQHEQFRNLTPDRAPEWMQDSVERTRLTYNSLREQARSNKSRLRQCRSADQQPTMLVQTTSGKSFVLQEINEERGSLPIWRADGQQPNWIITVRKNEQTTSERGRFPAQLMFTGSQGNEQVHAIGFVSPESAIENDFERRLVKGQRLSANSPSVSLQVPFAQQNDADMLYAQADRCFEDALKPPPGQDPDAYRQAIFSELWRSHHTGRKIVMQRGTDFICDRLSQAPEITVGQLKISSAVAQRLIDQSPHTIQFSKDLFPSKGGEILPSVSVLKPDGDRFLIGAVAGRNLALPAGATYMAAFFKNPKSEKVVDMQVMDLPAMAQTQTEVAAFADGRSHLTFVGLEPHAAYGVREGQVIIAQAEGGKPVALRVGDQHRIDARLAAKAGAAQRWADVEKASPSALFEQLAAAHSDGKELWGLNVELLGTYAKGQITPFSGSEQQQLVATQAVKEPVSVTQSAPVEKPASLQLYERYSDQNSGVLSAVAAGNPQLQQRLDGAVVERAITDGQSVEAVQDAIARHSPEAQRSGQPDAYAKNVVGQVTSDTAKVMTPPSKQRTQARTQQRHPPKRAKAKDNGMGY